MGLVRPALAEYSHTLYQFSERWVVDDSRFRGAFDDHATPLDDALAATVRWYRAAAGRDAEPRADARTDAHQPSSSR